MSLNGVIQVIQHSIVDCYAVSKLLPFWTGILGRRKRDFEENGMKCFCIILFIIPFPRFKNMVPEP